MITLKASANDIERALHELHHLASTGTGSDARHAGEFLLALWDGDSYPLNIQEFQYLSPSTMRQALQLFTFLMTTGTSLQKFMSTEAITQVEDHLRTLNHKGFFNGVTRMFRRPEPPQAPAARTLP